MSWWFYKRGRDGKRELWAVDIYPLIPIMVIACLFAMILLKPNPLAFVTVLVSLSGLLGVCGFVCLLLSKISLFRQGIWISWGTKPMSERNARLYRIGYVLLIIGAFASWLFSRLLT